MARGATLHKDRGHRHKLSVGVEFVTVMRDRVFKTGLGVGRISASYLFSALRNVHRPFFTDILSSPLPIAPLSFSLSLFFFSFSTSSRFLRPRVVGNRGGIIHIRSFLSNFFLLLFFLPSPPPPTFDVLVDVRRISGISRSIARAFHSPGGEPDCLFNGFSHCSPGESRKRS